MSGLNHLSRKQEVVRLIRSNRIASAKNIKKSIYNLNKQLYNRIRKYGFHAYESMQIERVKVMWGWKQINKLAQAEIPGQAPY